MRDNNHSAVPVPFPILPVAEDNSDKERRVHELAGRLMRTIGVARALVRGGRTLNLAGMDDGVGLLCAQALDLPAARGRAMLPQLTAVLAEIDALSGALREAGAENGVVNGMVRPVS